jgi:hypothetical protein
VLPFASIQKEHNLWVAVIKQAAEDLINKDVRLSTSARTWFYSRMDGPGSFLWICDHFRLDADWLRHRLVENDQRNCVAATLEETGVNGRVA